jgi:hypothetical protein
LPWIRDCCGQGADLFKHDLSQVLEDKLNELSAAVHKLLAGVIAELHH